MSFGKEMFPKVFLKALIFALVSLFLRIFFHTTEVGKVRKEGAHDQKCPSFAMSARKILESLETHMKRKPVKKPWYNHPKLLYTHIYKKIKHEGKN